MSAVSELAATEKARDIALESAKGYLEDRDRWRKVAEHLAEHVRELVDEWQGERRRNGYDSLTDSMMRALAALDSQTTRSARSELHLGYWSECHICRPDKDGLPIDQQGWVVHHRPVAAGDAVEPVS